MSWRRGEKAKGNNSLPWRRNKKTLIGWLIAAASLEGWNDKRILS